MIPSNIMRRNIEKTCNRLQGAGKIDVTQFQTLMLPLLKVMGCGHEMTNIQMRDGVTDKLFMTVEGLSKHLRIGAQNALNNQMGWAITILYKACLLTRPRRGIYIISEIGKQVLIENPVEIDAEFLRSYDNIKSFTIRQVVNTNHCFVPIPLT